MKPLRAWRTEEVLSLRDLAKAAGTSDKTVLQIELGRQVPTFRTIRRICAALGVEAAEVTEFAAAIREKGKGAP